MFNNWLNKDDSINLPKLFEHYGYIRVVEETSHIILKRNNQYSVVIQTEEGFKYYKVEQPEKKYNASSLIIEEVSRIEGKKNESIWDKVDEYYNKVLKSKDLLIHNQKNINLTKVALDFNHFLSYNIPFSTHQSDLYSTVLNDSCFKDKIFLSKSGEPIFPFFNLKNQITGYWVEKDDEFKKFKESHTKYSFWYSNIPSKIDWLIVVNNPKEAIAFQAKFQLKNAVYFTLGEMNHDTLEMLLETQKNIKVKKIVLTFTGNKKVEGYLRDLNFLSYMEKKNFLLKVKGNEIKIGINKIDEKSPDYKLFVNFYNSTKKFNQGLAKSFLDYNKIMDQDRINKHSILVKNEGEFFNFRVPLEVNAIKYFVWSYYKHFLKNSIEILKPKQNNWFLEWESDQSLTIKGKEVQLKEYKIAL